MFQTSVYDLKIFEGIERSVIDSIISECPRESFEKWATLMVQGESPNGKGYIIKSGQVQVLVDGEEVATLWDGDLVGEIALLNEEERSATVKALKNIEAITLSQEDMFSMIQSGDNSINKEIIRRMEENLER